MQDTPTTRSFPTTRSIIIIVVGVSLIIACGVINHILAPPSENRAHVSPAATTPAPAARGTLDYRRKASNNGADLKLPPDAMGHLSLAAIKVAVPGISGGITYIPGSDPAAIQYLAKSRAKHTALTYDAGPLAVTGPSAPRVSSDEIDSIPAQKSRP